MEEEGEALEEDECRHDPVDPEHLLGAVLLEDEDPEASGQEEKDGQHLVEGGQRHLAGGQVTVAVLLLDLDVEVDGQAVRPGPVLVVVAVVEEHAVEPLLLGVTDVDHEAGLEEAVFRRDLERDDQVRALVLARGLLFGSFHRDVFFQIFFLLDHLDLRNCCYGGLGAALTVLHFQLLGFWNFFSVELIEITVLEWSGQSERAESIEGKEYRGQRA